MKFKIVVRNETAGRDFIGDCIGRIYPFETYLGSMVEPRGGVYCIIEVECADDEYLTDVQQLFEPWIVDDKPHPTHNVKYYLQPVTEGDPMFTELFIHGRASVDIATFRTYIRERK